jgi:hypothetical protein
MKQKENPMGKVLADIEGDEAALAQWLMRKLRNHDPMSARDTQKKAPGHREKERQYVIAGVGPDGEAVVRYALNRGDVFEITIMKAQGTLAEKPLVALAED